MSRPISSGAGAAALLLAALVTLTAQSAPGSVSIVVRDVLASEDPQIPRTRRLYTEPQEIQLRVEFHNSATAPLLVNQTDFRDAFIFRLSGGGGEIPVDLEWRHEVDPEFAVMVRGTDSVRIEPGRVGLWTVVARRVDGQPFAAGSYGNTRGFRNMRQAVRTMDGHEWSGLVPDGVGQYTFRVQPAVTPAERALHHTLVGGEAQRVGHFEAALESYRRAAAEDPTDVAAMLGMAHSYFRLSRYREAVPVYEAILARPGAARSVLSPTLAQAYVGAGEDAKAVKLLESVGRNAEQVSVELANMRRYAADNPGR